MIFKRLRIANWRQFRELNLEFHDRLTILTGANGAGKTTILNFLSQ
jgi:predicted ATP-dependent endonuclease of OLD family